MTREYTAADFANAQFAEHADCGLATRSGGDYCPWVVGGKSFSTDEHMARYGWVPVPSKPTITESRVSKELAYETEDFKAGFHYALAILEAEIIPAPEPTNTDNLTELMKEIDQAIGLGVTPRTVAKYLNDNGVTAPKENK